MSETITEHQKPQPYANLQDVQGRIDELVIQFQDVSTELEHQFDTLDEATKSSLERAQDGYYEEANRAEQKVKFSDFLRRQNIVAEPFIATIAATEQLEDQIERVEQERERFAPEKAQEVAAAIRQLESQIDYDAVVRTIHNRKEGRCAEYDISRIIVARKLIESGTSINYAHLLSIENSLSQYTAEWRESGWLPTEPAEGESVVGDAQTQSEPLPNMSDVCSEFEQQVSTANRLNLLYRAPSFDRAANTVRHFLRQVPPQDAMPTLEELFSPNKLHMNSAFATAFQRAATEAIATLPSQDFELDTESTTYKQLLAEATAIDPEAASTAIEVSGDLAVLPFELTVAELKKYIVDRVLPIAINGIRQIEFKAMTAEEDPNNELNALHISGGEDKARIIVNTNHFESELQRNRGLLSEFGGVIDLTAETKLKNRVLDTLVHEMGHSLHTTLPVGALHEWRKTAEAEQVDVTAYVQRTHGENEHSHAAEDFADSVKLYTNNHAVFEIIAPERFMAMKKIYQDFGYPSGLKVEHFMDRLTRNQLIKDGIVTREAIKAIYLLHEKDAG